MKTYPFGGLDDSKGDYVPDIEKKIIKKYGIRLLKKGGRLSDGTAFIKSLYKDKL